MPAIRTGQVASAPKIILKYTERKVVMPCPPTYEAAIAAARADFAISPSRHITLHVDMACLEPGSREGPVEITSRAWNLLAGCAVAPVLDVRAAPAATPPLSADRLTFRVTGTPIGTQYLRVKPHARIGKMLKVIFNKYDMHADEWRVMLGPEDLRDSAHMSVSEFGLRTDDPIHCVRRESSG